jgi:hypothetical protein
MDNNRKSFAVLWNTRGLILWLSVTCAPIDILPPIKRLALPVLPVIKQDKVQLRFQQNS